LEHLPQWFVRRAAARHCLNDGILVEHWDVIQDEATKEQSKSKAPMFGTTFPVYAEV
jgi:hypothetical protein